MSLTYNGNNFQYVVPQSLPFGEVRRGCYYDAHGNTLTMPHLTNIGWDYLDQLHSAGNGTFTSYYNYDAEGKRTRKVVDKGTVVEHRYYFGEYEIYDKYVNGVLDTERTTVHLNDEQKRFVIIETLTSVTPFVVTERYQYDNHLGSACLELDSSSAIITYEEYYPFGVTSYRSGRTQAETSLKRYKYCGKERDEETGLYYYGMRYYAAWICRFVSVDPLQFKYPHYTPYQYAGNKPISYIDLDGGEEKVNENRNTILIKATYYASPEVTKNINVSEIESCINSTLNSSEPINMGKEKVLLYEMPQLFFNDAMNRKTEIIVDKIVKVKFEIKIIPNRTVFDLSEAEYEKGGVIVMGEENDEGFIPQNISYDNIGKPIKSIPAYIAGNKIVLNPLFFDKSNSNYHGYDYMKYDNNQGKFVDVISTDSPCGSIIHEIGHDLGLTHPKGVYPEFGVMSNQGDHIPTDKELKEIISPYNEKIKQP